MTTATVENVVTRDAPRAPLPPTDPAVRLPPSVVAAAERVQALHDQAYKQQAPEPQPGDQPVTSAGAAAPLQQTPVTAGGNAPAPAPQNSQPMPAAPEPPRPGEGVSAGEDHEHKFKSMQGRFQSSQAQLRQTQETLSSVSSELSQAVARLEQLEQERTAPPQGQRYITDQDRNEFGNEFIDVAARAAREVVSPEVEGLRRQLGEVTQTLQRNAVQGIYGALDQQLPNWRIINRHPTFVAWLGLRDPMSGASRRVLLDSAFRSADAHRVLAIFQGFVAEDAARQPAPPQPQQSSPAPAPASQQPAVALETLAAPGRARSTPTAPGAVEKPMYTQRDIAVFYGNVRKGVYIGRDAEKNAQEADIFAAQREGRVRG